jgi:hypothetical protein
MCLVAAGNVSSSVVGVCVALVQQIPTPPNSSQFARAHDVSRPNQSPRCLLAQLASRLVTFNSSIAMSQSTADAPSLDSVVQMKQVRRARAPELLCRE